MWNEEFVYPTPNPSPASRGGEKVTTTIMEE